MPAGQPTLYNDSYNNLVDEYIASCGREQTELPTIEGFAIKIGVHRDTLYEWAKHYPEFSDTIKKIEQVQKNQLMNDGLYGGKEINAGMAIFLLKVNHGMVETSRQELGGVSIDGKPQPLRLLVNAGNGFLPPNITVSTSPAGGVAAVTSTVQGSDLAPQSTENIHSDNGVTQTSSS